MNAVVDRLADTIRSDFHCDVRHVRGVEVREPPQGVIVWHGVVEIFDLIGHPSATRCYSWAHDRDGKERRIVVLHAGPVDSPVAAVRAAIVHQDRTGSR